MTFFSFVMAAAAVGGGGKHFTNSLAMSFVRIEAGAFTMGTGELPPTSREQWEQRDWDEAPVHTVSISRPFFMAVCEVTNSQYEQFDAEHRKLRGIGNASKGDNEPVTIVTW